MSGPASTGAQRIAAEPDLPYSFSNAFSLAGKVFTNQYVFLLAASGIMFGLSIATSLLSSAFTAGASAIDPAFGMFVNIGSSIATTIFVSYPLYACMLYAGLAARRGEPITLKNLLLAFYQYPRALAASAILFGIIIALLIPVAAVVAAVFYICASAGVNESITFFITFSIGLLGALFLLLSTVRLFPALVLAIDPAINAPSAMAALRISWECTKGHTLSLAALWFVILLITSLSVLVLCVGVIFLGYPFMIAAFAAAYHQLLTQRGYLGNRGRCRNCGYDVRSINSLSCPECGTRIATNSPTQPTNPTNPYPANPYPANPFSPPYTPPTSPT
jgi:hypothetical protein